jgi:hypothetical protein
MTNWISVKDRLPEDDQECWIVDNGSVEFSLYSTKDGFENIYTHQSDMNVDYFENVELWQPMTYPAPPKE